jgi:hypothetical protein
MTKKLYDLHVAKDEQGLVDAEAFHTKYVFIPWMNGVETVVTSYRRNELPGMSEMVEKSAEELKVNDRIETKVYI